MPQSPADNYLADRHYVSAVLRLVLDEHGKMIYGELVSAPNILPIRFSGWRGMTRAVRNWLSRQEQDGASDDRGQTSP